MSSVRNAAVALAISLATCLSACGPAYPACVKDADCQLGEFCVRQVCQMCRSNDDCPLTHRCVQGDCKEGAR